MRSSSRERPLLVELARRSRSEVFAQLVPQIAEAVATTASGPEAARRATALSTYGPSAIDAVRSHLEVRASRERTTPLGELHLLKILEDHAARTTREQ